ncbi:MAG: iron-containing alcohol dehydrogenase [Vampirovibrionales bacterium]|nr:iron-containing alcohol dehydrogenase [Vampirovibrionales bacterium]
MTAFVSSYQPNRVATLLSATTIHLGEGAISKLSEALAQLKASDGISNVLVVASKGAYRVSGAWAAIEPQLQQAGLKIAVFDGISANPTVDEIEAARALGKSVQANLILAIGGGSPIDAGKGVAALLANAEYSARELYSLKKTPKTALPIIAVCLTHGTGSEANRYSVATLPETQHKPGIGYPCLYPRFSIVDPSLMHTLSVAQTRITAVDALNHALEAATSKIANPLSIALAKEAVALIVHYLPLVLTDPQHREGRWALATAATLAGIAIDNSAVHVTHALEHPLSGLQPTLPHALGLAMLLPAVLEACYDDASDTYAMLLEPLLRQHAGDECSKRSLTALEVATRVERWLFSIGMSEKLISMGFFEEQIPHLVDLVHETPTLLPLVSLAPGKLQRSDLVAIYQRSLKPLNSLSTAV